MALKVETLARVFKYSAMELADPGAAMSPQEVKTFYSALYPELNNSEVEGPETKGRRLIYTFTRSVGTKG